MAKIYDRNGVEQDYGWMQQTYGVMFSTWESPYELFQLQEIHEREGPVVISVQVLREAGAPEYNRKVAFWWEGIPVGEGKVEDLSDCPEPQPHSHALIERTNPMGIANFTFGPSAMIKDLKLGGPFDVWVVSPSTPSDMVCRIGWLGGTEHRGMHYLRFRLVNEGQEVPPTAEPPKEPGVVCRLALRLANWIHQRCG